MEVVRQIKDGFGDAMNIGMVNVGGSGDPVLLPTSVPHDAFGNPLLTDDNPAVIARRNIIVAANFRRPGNTTPYDIGQLIANDTSAPNVQPMVFTAARVKGGIGRIERARLFKTVANTTNATFRAHFYAEPPTPQSGDGGAWLTASSGYIGSIDFDMQSADARTFSDGNILIAAPSASIMFAADPSSQHIYALLEARNPYTPGSGEEFTLTLELTTN